MIWYHLTSIVSPCPAAFKSTALGVSSGSADEIEKMLPWSAQKHKLTGILESPVSRFLVFKSFKGCQMVPTVWSKGHLFHFFFRGLHVLSCCLIMLCQHQQYQHQTNVYQRCWESDLCEFSPVAFAVAFTRRRFQRSQLCERVFLDTRHNGIQPLVWHR